MNLKQTARLAVARAKAGKTVPLERLFSALVGPVRLARAPETITWVGGDVPGGQRAIGFWPGGTERSSVVTVPDAQTAIALAHKNAQKSALWFTPGEGNDVLHVLRVRGDARAVHAGLVKHGVSEMTVIPHAGVCTVHVVDAGGVNAQSVRAFATQSGAEYTARPGTARFSVIK